MNKEMRVPLTASSRDTFLRQMIPHHLNAVNMAKLLVKKAADGAIKAVDGLGDILYGIVNTQNFQINQFRNILEGIGDTHGQCIGEELNGNTMVDVVVPTAVTPTVLAADSECVPSDTPLCMSLDPFASETGYYNFAEHTGSSPDIIVRIGETYTFDQSDHTNWYHPVGFAYQPDGAHGSTWGGDELPEVEGAGELMYKINGTATVGATESENYCGDDTGDTGLDCYEPEASQARRSNHIPQPSSLRSQAPHP